MIDVQKQFFKRGLITVQSLESGVPQNIGFVQNISEIIPLGALEKALG